ncbi:MAG: alkaline phosphatase family protein [Solirubrobacteraceae bacterium]
MTDQRDIANLQKVEHVVVLMLENRSFDHMLGYLSLEGGRGDVDGLEAQFANRHGGRTYRVHHLDSTAIADDPEHSAAGVDLQLGDGEMDGFVASFARTLERGGVPDADPGRVMGYYNAGDVPVYDHLARQFAVCDRWFCSVPGATWPNRLYALCGRAARSRDDWPPNVPPLYREPSFVRHLDAHEVSWRWYSFETGTLRLADAQYRLGHLDRFAFFSHTKLNWKQRLQRGIDAEAPSFLDDAARGTLPSVAWIDPNFSNFNPIGFQPNDDHAPADIKDGQALVLAVYHALATGPQWEKTLLIIFYDEHGGFIDHVPPPETHDDDPGTFGRYGVRVPALIVSPWIEPGSVSHTVFDHTTIIKTILLRFCPEALAKPNRYQRLTEGVGTRGRPRYMGTRVAYANNLGELLVRTTPRPPPDRYALIEDAAARTAARAKDTSTDHDVLTGQPQTDLQKRIAAANRELTKLGHPRDRP